MTGSHVSIGAAVSGSSGELLGHVAAVYADNATGVPMWVAVQGRHHVAVVPLGPSRFDGSTLHVPFNAERLQSAPLHDPATLISYPQGEDLARHYGLIPPATHPDPPTQDQPRELGKRRRDEPGRIGHGPDRSDAPVMIRSEEQLRTATVNVVVGRARLEVYTVTEDQTFTVPVRRQEVRLVHDPVPVHEQTTGGPPPAEETYQVVLHAEQVLFTTQVIAVERVRLVKRVTTTGQTVGAQVSVERIDTELIDTAQVDTAQVDTAQVDAGRDVVDPENGPGTGGPDTGTVTGKHASGASTWE